MTTAKDKLSTLVDTLVATLSSSNITLTSAQVTNLKQVASTWLDGTQYKTLSLAENKPDFNQLMLQFQNALEHEGAWSDTITASAGQAILRFISAAVDRAILAQERSTQERYSFLARLPSAIIASARSLGVHVSRRTPANVGVYLTNSTGNYLNIPAFTPFTVGSTKCFNREPIVFAQGSIAPVEATLYQGQVFTDTYTSSGQPFAMYEVGNNDASISEQDVYVYVNGQQYTLVTDGFYLYGPRDMVAYQNSLANGNVEIITGSGNYGVMPSSGDQITIVYATTDGTSAENSNVELPVLCPSVSTLTGYSTTPIAHAVEPQSVEFYRINAPYIRSQQQRSVTRRDYVQTALQYKGMKIHDARAIGQADINPNSKAYMGVIQMCVLTDTLMTDAQWNDFVSYMQATSWDGFTIIRQNPQAVPINAAVNIGMLSSFGLTPAQLAAVTAIVNNYAPKQGILGQTFYRHDLSSALLRSSDSALQGGIDYIEISSPTFDSQDMLWYQYPSITSPVVTTEYSTRAYSNQFGFTPPST